jgi:hypothetical protein
MFAQGAAIASAALQIMVKTERKSKIESPRPPGAAFRRCKIRKLISTGSNTVLDKGQAEA